MKKLVNNFEDYKNIKDEKSKLEQVQQKIDLINSLNQVSNVDGSPYFSTDWLKKNILGYDK